MKNNNNVLNARKVREGRRLARWAAAGMNWGGGAMLAPLMEQGRKIAADKAACQALYERVSQLAQGEDVTQSMVAKAVHALNGARAALAALAATDDSWAALQE